MRFQPDPDALHLGDPQYGIYWLKDKEIHRTGMTYNEAVAWLDEAQEDFPNKNVREIWGVCWSRWDAV